MVGLVYCAVVHVLALMLDPVFDFVDFAGVKLVVVGSEVSGDTTKTQNVIAVALRTFARNVSDVPAGLTLVVRKVESHVWDIVIHTEEHQRFLSINIVLDRTGQLDVRHASSGRVSGEHAFQFELIQGRQMLPHWDVHGVCEELLVTDVRDDAIALTELLERSVTQVFCRSWVIFSPIALIGIGLSRKHFICTLLYFLVGFDDLFTFKKHTRKVHTGSRPCRLTFQALT